MYTYVPHPRCMAGAGVHEAHLQQYGGAGRRTDEEAPASPGEERPGRQDPVKQGPGGKAQRGKTREKRSRTCKPGTSSCRNIIRQVWRIRICSRRLSRARAVNAPTSCGQRKTARRRFSPCPVARVRRPSELHAEAEEVILPQGVVATREGITVAEHIGAVTEDRRRLVQHVVDAGAHHCIE